MCPQSRADLLSKSGFEFPHEWCSMLSSIALIATLALPITQGSGSTHDGELRSIPWPSATSAPGFAGEGCTLEFTGDAMLDAFVLDGQRITLLQGLAAYDAIVDTLVDASALAALPSLDPSQGGSLLFADGSGLGCMSYDPVGSSSFPTTTVRSNAPWPSVGRLRTADLDGSHRLDLIGLDAAGASVQLLYSDSDTAPTFGQDAGFATGRPGLDVAAVDWDGDGTNDVAVLTTAGVFVFDQAGNSLGTLFKPFGATVMPSLIGLHSAAGAGFLAWMCSSATQTLLYIDSAAGGTIPIDVTLEAVGQLAGADYDNDGDAELFVVANVTNEVLLLDPIGNPNVGLSDAYVFPFSSGLPDMTAVPLLGDLDGDDDFDLLVPYDAAETVQIFFGTLEDAAEERIHIAAPGSLGLTSSKLRFYLDFDPATFPVLATHVELKIHYQHSLAEFVEPSHPNNSVQRFDVSQFGSQSLEVVVPFDNSNPLLSDEIFHFVLRAIREDSGTGDVIDAWSPTVAAYSSDAGVLDVLSTQPGAGDVVFAIPEGDSGGGGGWACQPSTKPKQGGSNMPIKP